VLRHTFARAVSNVGDYRIEQHGDTLHLATPGGDAVFAAMKLAADCLVMAQGMQPPAWQRAEMPIPVTAAKRRRIVCMAKPALNELRDSSITVRHDT
jgi:hypothetical protein